MSNISRRTAIAGISVFVTPAIAWISPAATAASVGFDNEMAALLAAGWRRVPIGHPVGLERFRSMTAGVVSQK